MFAWIKKLFGKSGHVEEQHIGVVGLPIHFNPSPIQRYERNLARIGRCREAMEKLKRQEREDSKSYKKLEFEYRRRVLALEEYEFRKRGDN